MLCKRCVRFCRKQQRQRTMVLASEVKGTALADQLL